uniref:AAA+ ATPase domain-containing protein n=1 Tax=Zooxanthella nutricula TaxID=1333877 RepID=A0A7S2ITI0_9DINO
MRGQLFSRRLEPVAGVPDVPLDEVAGIGAAKAEALEIVECLMAPAKFAGLGAKCPKGLLLTGPPGCGKTLLARAIASAASVPFISRSGADFNHRFAGVGSSMVKELFREARKFAPAVILIDEIDYIGRRRGEERGGGLETDRSAALTQLLAEMDGFNPIEGVVVIGTTNRPDILDKALLRPGRFDRRVTVPLPDLLGRVKILRKHAQRLPLEQHAGRSLTGPSAGPVAPVDWALWAKRTPGFSGADLAGLVNEAAMAAAREGARGVGDRHVQTAYSKALLGVPSGRHPSRAEMNLTAAHEAGHAVVNEAMRAALGLEGQAGFRTVAHISIVPAGDTGGVTQFASPDEGRQLPESRRVLLAQLAVSMGGRAAEELLQGRREGATMGASSDFEHATRLATQMVERGGLSSTVGPRALTATGASPPSQELRRKVDAEVDKLLRDALAAARTALEQNRELHAAVAEALLEKETLDGEAFKNLVQRHSVKPVAL